MLLTEEYLKATETGKNLMRDSLVESSQASRGGFYSGDQVRKIGLFMGGDSSSGYFDNGVLQPEVLARRKAGVLPRSPTNDASKILFET